jgi:hypothetical protein
MRRIPKSGLVRFQGGRSLANLLTNWGGSGAGDIDGNGTVEPGDLTSLLAAWTG